MVEKYTKLLKYHDVIDILKRLNYLVDDKILKNDLDEERCGCCYCKDCNFLYDECVCEHNKLVKALKDKVLRRKI